MNGDTPMDARVHVLESDYKRLEEEIRGQATEIKDQGKRIQILESCAAGLPRIEGILTNDVLPVLKMLNECKIADDATARLKVSWWETLWGQRAWDLIRAVGIVVITLLVAMNQYMILGGK